MTHQLAWHPGTSAAALPCLLVSGARWGDGSTWGSGEKARTAESHSPPLLGPVGPLKGGSCDLQFSPFPGGQSLPSSTGCIPRSFAPRELLLGISLV